LKRWFAALAFCLFLIPLLPVTAAAPLPEPRAEFIDRMIGEARDEFERANGSALQAAYAGDRYVCKNFTVYLFRAHRDDFRIAEFPDKELVIPDNLPRKDSKPYVYGVAWLDIPASEGNPFIIAAEFRYDTDLGKEENRELARAFLRQVQRGDFFQMAANYYYGVGPHSLVFISDYDAETDSVRWTDSNMKGKKINGVQHGYIQYDAEKKIDWFVDAFCRKGYGATIYRLREDIVYAHP
jgi:hypothetical protein